MHTPESKARFDRWFKRSVVVDEDGQPLVMYHGTYSQSRAGQRDIDSFDRNWSKGVRAPSIDNLGVWLSDTPGEEGAQMYGDTLYPVYASAQRLKFFPSHDALLDAMHEAAHPHSTRDETRAKGLGDVEPLRTLLMLQGYDGIAIERTDAVDLIRGYSEASEGYQRAREEEIAAGRKNSGVPPSELALYAAKTLRLRQSRDAAARECLAQGVDISTGRCEFGGQNCIIVFEPGQIKSSISAMEFDADNPYLADRSLEQIRADIDAYCAGYAHQAAGADGQGQLAVFDQWFGSSAAVDSGGKPLLLFHGALPGRDIYEFALPCATSLAWLTSDLHWAERKTTHRTLEPGAQGAIYPVYASVQRPYTVCAAPGTDEWDSFFELESQVPTLKTQGFDSAMLYNVLTNSFEHVACFYADQTKSALSAVSYAPGNPYLCDRSASDLAAEIAAICDAAAHKLAIADRAGGLGTRLAREAALEQWMAGSAAIDAAGRPLVLYHGTTADLDYFDLSLNGADGVDYGVPAIFATDSAALASDYALCKMDRVISNAVRDMQRVKNSDPSNRGDDYEAAYQAVRDAFTEVRQSGRSESGGGANVLPLHMRLLNPLRVDAQGQNFMETLPEAMKLAIERGHDGLIVLNVVDHASEASKFPSNLYVALSSESVKSATGGLSFDLNSPLLTDRTASQLGMDMKAYCNQVVQQRTLTVAQRVTELGEPISLVQAHDLVRGCTGKPGGVDPTMIYASGPKEGRTLILARVPLSLVRGNQAQDRYDSTVDIARAMRYAQMDSEPPPVILKQGRAGDLLVLDGGHRITSARLNGETYILALCDVWRPDSLLERCGQNSAQPSSGTATRATAAANEW